AQYHCSKIRLSDAPANVPPQSGPYLCIVIKSPAIDDASCRAQRTTYNVQVAVEQHVCKRALLCISFRRPLSQPFAGRYLARPLIEWTRGRASHAGAGIHIVLDMRHAGDLRAGADLHVADDTGLPTHHDEVAEFRRTSNAALGHDYAITADNDIVG